MNQWTVKQNCVDCGVDYQATHYQYAIEIDASQGLCPACFLARAKKNITVSCQDCHKPFITTYFGYRGMKLFISDVCPDCAQQRELAEAAKRATEIAAQRIRWRSASGIPEKFMLEGFETFELYPGDNNLRNILKVCQDYAEQFPLGYRPYVKQKGAAYPSLILFSGVGRGKTHLACAIGHQILNRWKGEPGVSTNPICFISEPELLLRIKATYSFSPEERQVRESESDIINYLASRDLLILDDVGKDPKPDMNNGMTFVRRILYSIINGRYNALRPVVLTTNFDVNSLGTYLGKSSDENAVYSRLVEMAGGAFHKLKGVDYRRK